MESGREERRKKIGERKSKGRRQGEPVERRRAERQRRTAAINRPERRNMEPEGTRRSKGEERRERGPDRLCERRSSEDQAWQQGEQGGRRGGGEGEATTAGGRYNSSVSVLYLNTQSIVGKV